MKKVDPFWKELIAHIDQEWKKKKARSYPFTGQDFKLIKQLRGWLTAPEVMSLFEIYCTSSPFWGPKTGYLVRGLLQEWSVLLEDSSFKKLVAKHEAELGMRSPKEVALELGLK